MLHFSSLILSLITRKCWADRMGAEVLRTIKTHKYTHKEGRKESKEGWEGGRRKKERKGKQTKCGGKNKKAWKSVEENCAE